MRTQRPPAPEKGEPPKDKPDTGSKPDVINPEKPDKGLEPADPPPDIDPEGQEPAK